MQSQIEVSVYLGSGNDSMLDLGNYLKQELPHLNIILKPINHLKHERPSKQIGQYKSNGAIPTSIGND